MVNRSVVGKKVYASSFLNCICINNVRVRSSGNTVDTGTFNWITHTILNSHYVHTRTYYSPAQTRNQYNTSMNSSACLPLKLKTSITVNN